jgi:hypothetical protein
MREHPRSAFDAAEVIDHARAAEKAIQQLCRATLGRSGMTPADVDIVVAHLAVVAAALPQAARQLGDLLAQANNDYVLQMDNVTETADLDLASRGPGSVWTRHATRLSTCTGYSTQLTRRQRTSPSPTSSRTSRMVSCRTSPRWPVGRKTGSPHRWAVEPVFRDDGRLSDERPRGQTACPRFRCMRAGIVHNRHYL